MRAMRYQVSWTKEQRALAESRKEALGAVAVMGLNGDRIEVTGPISEELRKKLLALIAELIAEKSK
jgi:hypothetical protein